MRSLILAAFLACGSALGSQAEPNRSSSISSSIEAGEDQLWSSSNILKFGLSPTLQARAGYGYYKDDFSTSEHSFFGGAHWKGKGQWEDFTAYSIFEYKSYSPEVSLVGLSMGGSYDFELFTLGIGLNPARYRSSLTQKTATHNELEFYAGFDVSDSTEMEWIVTAARLKDSDGLATDQGARRNSIAMRLDQDATDWVGFYGSGRYSTYFDGSDTWIARAGALIDATENLGFELEATTIPSIQFGVTVWF